MTSLEFIEKEIDTYKQLKEQAILRIPDEDDEIQLYLLQRRINTINERLPILEQIKAELEAWDFTKRELGLKVIERNCGMFGSRYALKIDYEDVIPLLDKEVESFKKALEAENEKEN